MLPRTRSRHRRAARERARISWRSARHPCAPARPLEAYFYSTLPGEARQIMYRQLRTTFSEAAELYDRMRPGYPRAVFEELAEFGRLGPGSRVLEIGCGTGQATLPLAQRGYRVTAVELGAELAAIARRKLAPFPRVEVVVSDFEDWSTPWSEAERGPAPWSEAERGSTPWSEAERGLLPADPFDAVVSATAFHWLDPAVRVARSAATLRPPRAGVRPARALA